VHQQRAEHQPHGAAGDDVAHRGAQLLHAAQPAVPGLRDEQQRRAEAGDPQPELAGRRDRPGSSGHRAGQRAGQALEDGDDDQAERQGQPGRLHALGHRTGAVSRTSPSGGAGRRPVGEEVQQRRRPGEQAAADRQAGQRDDAQVPDDGGVDEQVDRLGREHHQRREGEGEDRGPPRGRRDHVRRGHAAASSALSAAIVASRSTREV
jgi:hypothetical protein